MLPGGFHCLKLPALSLQSPPWSFTSQATSPGGSAQAAQCSPGLQSGGVPSMYLSGALCVLAVNFVSPLPKFGSHQKMPLLLGQDTCRCASQFQLQGRGSTSLRSPTVATPTAFSKQKPSPSLVQWSVGSVVSQT